SPKPDSLQFTRKALPHRPRSATLNENVRCRPSNQSHLAEFDSTFEKSWTFLGESSTFMATFIPEPGSVASDSGGGVEPWAGAGEVREHASSCVTRHTSGLHGPLRPIRAGAMVRHI